MPSETVTATTARTVTVDDIEVAYTRAGTGPVVVLIHGLAEDRHSWRPVQDALTDVTTYAYDLRGHGDTSVGSPEGTLTQLRDDLLRFLKQVTGPAVCVGFSLGGTIVLSAAAERPDLVTRVIAMGTSSVVGRGAVSFYDGRIALFQGTDRAEQESALRADTTAALHNPDSDPDQVTAARLTAIGDGRGYVNAATAMAALAQTPLTPTLSDISADVDVAIVGADHDAFCPRKAADIILAAIEHATFDEITGAGHLMLVDQPEQTVALLQRILSR